MDMNPVDITELIEMPESLYRKSISHTNPNQSSTTIDLFTTADRKYVYKDAIMFSGHKFIGGPSAPGLLAVKKTLLQPISMAPTIPGGGTVFYVTSDHHRYLSNREEREEAGTPNILGMCVVYYCIYYEYEYIIRLILHYRRYTIGISGSSQTESEHGIEKSYDAASINRL